MHQVDTVFLWTQPESLLEEIVLYHASCGQSAFSVKLYQPQANQLGFCVLMTLFGM